MSSNQYRISFDDAVMYIKNFASQFESVAINQAIGGTMFKSDLFNKAGLYYRGNTAWYCYNNSLHPEYPSLFLAFENDVLYNDQNELAGPLIDSKLECPNYESIISLPSDLGGITTQSIKSWVEGLNYFSSSNKSISPPWVTAFKENFKAYQMDLGHLNVFPYGFFENDPDRNGNIVAEFFDQDGLAGFRYFFGFSTDRVYEGNYLRLILIGINAQGQSLITTNDIILQKSWPPPPPR